MQFVLQKYMILFSLFFRENICRNPVTPGKKFENEIFCLLLALFYYSRIWHLSHQRYVLAPIRF